MDIEKLKAVVATLNGVTVSGKNNLNSLLACIQTLEKIIEEAKLHEA